MALVMPLGLPIDELVSSLTGARGLIENFKTTLELLHASTGLQSKVIQDLARELSREVQKLEAFIAAGQGVPEIFREAEQEAAKLLEREDVSDNDLKEFTRKFSGKLPQVRVARKALEQLQDVSPKYSISELAELLESKALERLANQSSKLFDVYDEGPDLEQAEAIIRDFIPDHFEE